MRETLQPLFPKRSQRAKGIPGVGLSKKNSPDTNFTKAKRVQMQPMTSKRKTVNLSACMPPNHIANEKKEIEREKRCGGGLDPGHLSTTRTCRAKNNNMKRRKRDPPNHFLPGQPQQRGRDGEREKSETVYMAKTIKRACLHMQVPTKKILTKRQKKPEQTRTPNNQGSNDRKRFSFNKKT